MDGDEVARMREIEGTCGISATFTWEREKVQAGTYGKEDELLEYKRCVITAGESCHCHPLTMGTVPVLSLFIIKGKNRDFLVGRNAKPHRTVFGVPFFQGNSFLLRGSFSRRRNLVDILIRYQWERN